MNLPLGLIAKSLVGLVSVGAVGGGSWVLWDKGSWTQFDKDVFKVSGTWAWTPTSNTAITTGTKELKIEASTTHSSKTWKCTILGKLPDPLGTGANSQINTQFSAIKTALGVTNGTWKPEQNEEAKKTAAEKFFSSCIKNRTWKEWWKAKRGEGWESTIHLEIVKDGTNNNYKFNEKEFKKLYGDETT